MTMHEASEALGGSALGRSSAQLEEGVCALCGPSASELLHSFPPYGVRRCRSCTLTFLSPRLTEAAMIARYQDPAYFEGGESGYDSYESQRDSLIRTFRWFLKSLSDRGIGGETLLDVGCGYGYFLECARELFRTTVGLEFSAEAAQRAALVADEVTVGGITSLDPDRRFSVISLIQVIEHLYAPVTFLEQLRRHLEPGGWILVATPNIGSWWYPLFRSRWPSFKLPEHVYFFSPETLSRALERAGFSEIQEIPYPHAFPVPLVLSKFGIPSPSFASQWSIPISGTTVALAARG